MRSDVRNGSSTPASLPAVQAGWNARTRFYKRRSRSEARALERAARLTPDAERRAQRFLHAGIAARRAGRMERADSLLQEAIETGLDTRERAYAQERRAFIKHEQGKMAEALELMLGEAEEVEGQDPRAAARLLTNAATVLQHQLDIPSAAALAERAWRLAGDGAIDDAELCHILSFQRVLSGRVPEAMELAWRTAELVENDPEGRVVVADAASTLLYAGEHAPARRLLERAVAANRGAGALGDLGYTLHIYAQVDWYDGRLHRAYVHALEAVQIVEELGTLQTLDDCLSRLALFEAVLGRESDSQGHGQRASSPPCGSVTGRTKCAREARSGCSRSRLVTRRRPSRNWHRQSRRSRRTGSGTRTNSESIRILSRLTRGWVGWMRPSRSQR